MKLEEDLWMLEQSTRALERNWNKLAAVRVSLRWQKQNWGKFKIEAL
jgi:hypothetical protein